MTDQPSPPRAAAPKKAPSAPAKAAARPGAAIRQRDLFQLDTR